MRNKILQAEGKELSQLLGEILQPEKNKHTIAQGSCMRGNCAKCGKNLDWSQWHKECISVDPVPIDDWNVAMKFFEAGIEKHGKAKMIKAMKEVYVSTTGNTNGSAYVMDWWVQNAGRIGHLRASAICESEAK